MPNELYSSLPTLVPILAPSSILTRAHSDTPYDAGFLEQSFTPSLEESKSVITSVMPTRYPSDTLRYAHPLESGYSPSLDESVTLIILLSHNSGVASSAFPTGKVYVIKS